MEKVIELMMMMMMMMIIIIIIITIIIIIITLFTVDWKKRNVILEHQIK